MAVQLAIKNMVCNRCIKVVRDELEKLGHSLADVRLGEAVLNITELSAEQREDIRRIMEENGFELLDDKKRLLIENVKIQVIEVIQHGDEELLSRIVFSHYLSEKLGVDYSHISTLFSQMEGITLEKYIIMQKIERVKELMLYDELSLSEIAYKLGYSSVHHLSNQFKKATGMTPTEFKRLQQAPRIALDKIGK